MYMLGKVLSEGTHTGLQKCLLSRRVSQSIPRTLAANSFTFGKLNPSLNKDIYIYIYIYIYTYTYTYTRTCNCTYTYTCPFTYTHTSMYMHLYMYMYMYIYVYGYTGRCFRLAVQNTVCCDHLHARKPDQVWQGACRTLCFVERNPEGLSTLK